MFTIQPFVKNLTKDIVKNPSLIGMPIVPFGKAIGTTIAESKPVIKTSKKISNEITSGIKKGVTTGVKETFKDSISLITIAGLVLAGYWMLKK